MTKEESNRLNTLLRHINNVQTNCRLLAERLIDKGENDFARTLIANSMAHDNSKFFGIEWLYLHGDVKEQDSKSFALAAQQHIYGRSNKHHPEGWGGIKNMPRIHLAELVCDWKSRSDEFGNDLRTWIRGKGTKQYDFAIQSKVYKIVKEFVDMLLDPEFQ